MSLQPEGPKTEEEAASGHCKEQPACTIEKERLKAAQLLPTLSQGNSKPQKDRLSPTPWSDLKSPGYSTSPPVSLAGEEEPTAIFLGRSTACLASTQGTYSHGPISGGTVNFSSAAGPAWLCPSLYTCAGSLESAAYSPADSLGIACSGKRYGCREKNKPKQTIWSLTITGPASCSQGTQKGCQEPCKEVQGARRPVWADAGSAGFASDLGADPVAQLW